MIFGFLKFYLCFRYLIISDAMNENFFHLFRNKKFKNTLRINKYVDGRKSTVINYQLENHNIITLFHSFFSYSNQLNSSKAKTQAHSNIDRELKFEITL